jgi:DNA-directed RNA polymerases I, II, and III subunit RPABC5
MLIPVRCFTCNKVTGNKWEPYCKMKEEGYSDKDALDKLGLTRYCCRRVILGHVNIIDQMLDYPLNNMKSLSINE